MPALADPSVYITRSGARDVIRLAEAAWLVVSLWFLSMTPSSVEYTAKLFGVIHGSQMYSSIFYLFARLSGSLYFPLIEEAWEDQLLRLFLGGCALVRASFRGWSLGMRAAFSCEQMQFLIAFVLKLGMPASCWSTPQLVFVN